MASRANSSRSPRPRVNDRAHSTRRYESTTALNEAFLRAGHLSFVVATSKAFDYRAFQALLPNLPGIELFQCVADLDAAAAICKKLRPDVVILDVSYPDGNAFTVGHELLLREWVRAVLFFDWRFAFWRALKSLECGPLARYFTRDFDMIELCLRMRLGVEADDRSFVSSLAQLRKLDVYGLLALSPKEIQVMQWLTGGHSIRGVAEKLGLAESTVDNHKARLMGKLKVNRTAALVRIAIDVGLID